MTKDDFERAIDAYLLQVRAKLMRGWDMWRDGNAGNMSPDRIMREIADEAVDFAGWGFWSWLHTQRRRETYPTPPPVPIIPPRP